MSLKLQNRHFIQKEEGKFPAGAAIISNLLPKAKNKIGGTAELLSAGGGRNSRSPKFLIWHDEIHPRNETPLTLKLLLPVRSLPFCRSRGARPKLVAQESWGNQGYVVVDVLTFPWEIIKSSAHGITYVLQEGPGVGVGWVNLVVFWFF